MSILWAWPFCVVEESLTVGVSWHSEIAHILLPVLVAGLPVACCLVITHRGSRRSAFGWESKSNDTILVGDSRMPGIVITVVKWAYQSQLPLLLLWLQATAMSMWH